VAAGTALAGVNSTLIWPLPKDMSFGSASVTLDPTAFRIELLWRSLARRRLSDFSVPPGCLTHGGTEFVSGSTSQLLAAAFARYRTLLFPFLATPGVGVAYSVVVNVSSTDETLQLGGTRRAVSLTHWLHWSAERR
jgi:hypothetical protein